MPFYVRSSIIIVIRGWLVLSLEEALYLRDNWSIDIGQSLIEKLVITNLLSRNLG